MKRALGIDLGEARIGLAIADDLGMLAHPLETIFVDASADPTVRIGDIVRRDRIEIVVLGLPRNMDGSYGPAAAKARSFGDALRDRIAPCEIRLWDERLTSVAAQRALHAAGHNVKQSRAMIDQVAAQLILQGWLDAQAMIDETR